MLTTDLGFDGCRNGSEDEGEGDEDGNDRNPHVGNEMGKVLDAREEVSRVLSLRSSASVQHHSYAAVLQGRLASM